MGLQYSTTQGSPTEEFLTYLPDLAQISSHRSPVYTSQQSVCTTRSPPPLCRREHALVDPHKPSLHDLVIVRRAGVHEALTGAHTIQSPWTAERCSVARTRRASAYSPPRGTQETAHTRSQEAQCQ